MQYCFSIPIFSFLKYFYIDHFSAVDRIGQSAAGGPVIAQRFSRRFDLVLFFLSLSLSLSLCLPVWFPGFTAAVLFVFVLIYECMLERKPAFFVVVLVLCTLTLSLTVCSAADSSSALNPTTY